MGELDKLEQQLSKIRQAISALALELEGMDSDLTNIEEYAEFDNDNLSEEQLDEIIELGVSLSYDAGEAAEFLEGAEDKVAEMENAIRDIIDPD